MPPGFAPRLMGKLCGILDGATRHFCRPYHQGFAEEVDDSGLSRAFQGKFHRCYNHPPSSETQASGEYSPRWARSAVTPHRAEVISQVLAENRKESPACRIGIRYQRERPGNPRSPRHPVCAGAVAGGSAGGDGRSHRHHLPAGRQPGGCGSGAPRAAAGCGRCGVESGRHAHPRGALPLHARGKVSFPTRV